MTDSCTSRLTQHVRIDVKDLQEVGSPTRGARRRNESEPDIVGVAIMGKVIRGRRMGCLYALDARPAPFCGNANRGTEHRRGPSGRRPSFGTTSSFIGEGRRRLGHSWRHHAFPCRRRDRSYCAFDLVQPATRRVPPAGRSRAARCTVAGPLGLRTHSIGKPRRCSCRSVIPGRIIQGGPARKESFSPTLSSLACTHRRAEVVVSAGADDDKDWDTTVVSLFESHGRKLVGRSGQGWRAACPGSANDGKRVFTLPVTTCGQSRQAGHGEGIHVCPVAGVAMNGPAYSPHPGCCMSMPLTGCTSSSSAQSQNGVLPYRTRDWLNGWGTNHPIQQWHGWTNRPSTPRAER